MLTAAPCKDLGREHAPERDLRTRHRRRTPTSSSTPCGARRDLVARDRIAARAADDDGRRQPRRRASGRSCGARRARTTRPPASTGSTRISSASTASSMPATQHDAVLWLSGSALRRRLRRRARGDRRARAGSASVAERDLELAVPPRPRPHRLHRRHREPDADRGARGRARPRREPRRRRHDPAPAEVGARRRRRGSRSPSSAQERVIGRTKADSIELEDKPADSHVASTDQDRFGKIFRRNMPYGDGHRPRDDVRRLLRRAAAARRDAREHGRPRRAAPATRSRATRARSPARTTSFRRPTRFAGSHRTRSPGTPNPYGVLTAHRG